MSIIPTFNNLILLTLLIFSPPGDVSLESYCAYALILSITNNLLLKNIYIEKGQA